MARSELDRRFLQVEADLNGAAARTHQLRAQGLLELADQEHERWKALGAEYINLAGQLLTESAARNQFLYEAGRRSQLHEP